MKEETSFTQDFRNFGITLLTGLGPLVLFTELFIDRIAVIFQLQALTAFCIYLALYFLMPLLILVTWSVVYKSQRVSEENSPITNIIPVAFMLIATALAVSFFLPKPAMLVLCIAPGLAAGIVFFIAGSKLATAAKPLKGFVTAQTEFVLMITAGLVLGAAYLWANVPDVKSLDRLILATDPVFNEPLREGNIKLSESWIELVNRTNLIGTLGLFSMFILFACGWYYYSLLNIIKKNEVSHEKKSTRLLSSPEGYIVAEPEFRNLAAQSTFKILILYVVLLLIPVFQPVKAGKDKQHPFLNLVQIFRLQIGGTSVITDPVSPVEPIRYDSIRAIVHTEVKGIRDSIPYLNATFESVKSLQDKFGANNDDVAEFHPNRGKKVKDPLGLDNQ